MAKRISFEEELQLGHLDLLGGLSAKEEYLEEMGKLFEEHDDYIFVSPEGGSISGKLLEVRQKFPNRFVELGIAEANAVGTAAGIALCGKTVFIQVMGPFLSLRSLDQVHTDIAYQNLPVRLINSHAGLTSGGGPTHYNIMDIAIMRAMPNMTVVCPADANQCKRLIRATENFAGPINIRLPRGKEPLVYTTQDYDFEIGKAVTAVEGDDITIIATGSTVAMAVSAANGLAKEGISARVLDMHTIKPIDREAICKAARETGHIITVEDHVVVGGLHGAVAEVLVDAGINVKLKALGIPDDGFPPLGDMYELFAYLGYDPEGIKKTARELLGR